MAAYAALVSLMHIIDDIESCRSPPISLHKQQLQSLTENVMFLQEFLEAYKSPVSDGDEVDPLEMRIADAAYAAEDAIESHIVAMIRLHREMSSRILVHTVSSVVDFFQRLGQMSTWSFIKMLFSTPDLNYPKNLLLNQENERMNLFQKVQNVMEEMDEIKRVTMETNTEKVRSFVSDSVYSSVGVVVWSDDVLLGILERLVADQQDRQVIPITGMGGIGKTTLAKTIYSDPIIKERFDVCAWANISQQYNTREILCELVSQATNKSKEQLSDRSEDELGLELYQYLSFRRFLIVMDDLWSIDSWDRIQLYFPDNENCSRVLVTTRLSQLSSQLNKDYSLQMRFLDEDRSWNLFSKIVFGVGSCPRELEKIGKEIVENCRGLPLSIVVVGGVLKNMERAQGCWESIGKNLTSVVNLENDKHCLKLLKMSYNHLPVYLKPCFLYMGAFEENDSVEVSKLVKLWVLEGFIKPMNGKSLKTIAKEFLKDLVDRNLILVDALGSRGNIKLVKIHDLLRDLCLMEGKRDGFYHVIGESSPPGINSERNIVITKRDGFNHVIGKSSTRCINSQRRIVIPRNTSKEKILELRSMSHARSIICEYGKVPQCSMSGLLRTILAYNKYRAFEEKSRMRTMVSLYVNLRQLAVEVGSLPSNLSEFNDLWNLQTLILFGLPKFTAPTEIWNMAQLRHIEMSGGSLRLPDPSNGNAVVMQNLVVLKGAHNFKCDKEVVKRIPNIEKLGIQYSGEEGINHDDYYCLSNIKCLRKLESLDVCSEKDFRGNASLHKLSFPQTLKSLTLWMKGDFEWEGMLEKMGALPLLEKFKLWCGSFGTGKWEVVEGHFPRLKFLVLNRCAGLEHWTAEASSDVFPRLEKLHLFNLKELKEIPFQIGEIPTLQKIWLIDCSESAVMCVKEIVEEQVASQGDDLPFHVQVCLVDKNEAVQSLAGPNFEVMYS